MPKKGKHTLCEHVQWKRTSTCHKSYFVWKFTGKMPEPNPERAILCGNLQEKRTWRCDKSHFVWKFIGKIWKNAGPVFRARPEHLD